MLVTNVSVRWARHRNRQNYKIFANRGQNRFVKSVNGGDDKNPDDKNPIIDIAAGATGAAPIKGIGGKLVKKGSNWFLLDGFRGNVV